MIIGKAKYKVGDKVKIISNVYDTMNCLDRYNKVLSSSKQNMQKYAGTIAEIQEVKPFADCVEYLVKGNPYIWVEELFEDINYVKVKAIRITNDIIWLV
jgi:DNA integrity scanning protein DisA with diadenylate cyclase activity